jgi:hypothetical protein
MTRTRSHPLVALFSFWLMLALHVVNAMQALMPTARYHGRKGVVYMSTTGTGNATNVIALNAWNIDRSTDKAEATAFGDGNKVYLAGLPDAAGSISGFWDNTETKPFAGGNSADGVKLYLYPSSDIVTSYFYGPAWVDPSLTTGVGDVVAISFDWAANGTWGSQGI